MGNRQDRRSAFAKNLKPSIGYYRRAFSVSKRVKHWDLNGGQYWAWVFLLLLHVVR